MFDTKEEQEMKRKGIITVAMIVAALTIASSGFSSAGRHRPVRRPVVVVRPVTVVRVNHVWVTGHWEWFGPNRGYRWIPGHRVRR